MVNLVFSSANYQVVEYPELAAFELVDNRRGTGGLLSGAVADRFRSSMEDVFAHNPTEEDVEDVIEHFDALLMQPLHFH